MGNNTKMYVSRARLGREESCLEGGGVQQRLQNSPSGHTSDGTTAAYSEFLSQITP